MNAGHHGLNWRVAFGLVAAAVIATDAVFTQTSPPSSRAPTDEVTLRIIITNSEDEASRVVEQLKSGSDFAALAKTLSIDPTADNGGLLGKVPLSSLRPELRSALQGVGVGGNSGVVQVPTGFAILRVVPDAEIGNDASAVSPAVTAIGSVKYVLNVDGLGQANAILNQFSKPTDWNQDPNTICQMRTQSLAAVRQALERDLSSATAPLVLARPLDLAPTSTPSCRTR